MSEDSPKRRRWLQFRLRTLLVAVFVLSLPLSWLAVRLERARRQRAAILAVERAGGTVLSDWEIQATPSSPPLLSKFFGDEFNYVTIVTFCGQDFDHAVLMHLKRIYNLPTLFLDWSNIDDEGLQHLKGLDSLRALCLNYTSVTDRGLSHLAELPNLEHLGLQGTSITDSGLKYLETATHLKHLDLLSAEGVSMEAIERFRSAQPNCEVLADSPEADSDEERGQIWFTR